MFWDCEVRMLCKGGCGSISLFLMPKVAGL